MIVQDPSESPTPARVSSTASPSPDLVAESRLSHEALNQRLAAIEARLAGIEQAIATLSAGMAAERPVALAVGTPAATVRAAFGDPLETARGARGEIVWLYDGGRSVTFDGTGRVLAWSGF